MPTLIHRLQASHDAKEHPSYWPEEVEMEKPSFCKFCFTDGEYFTEADDYGSYWVCPDCGKELHEQD